MAITRLAVKLEVSERSLVERDDDSDEVGGEDWRYVRESCRW